MDNDHDRVATWWRRNGAVGSWTQWRGQR